jgi:hypothetical protein
MNILDGAVRLSRDTSDGAKWVAGSKTVAEGVQISPERKNPKKQTFMAAQSIRRFHVHACENKNTCTFLRMPGVMGSRGFEGLFFDEILLTPFSSSWSLGSGPSNPGNGDPMRR